MSVESLKRVLMKIKGQAREMRKEKHAKRIAPKAKVEKPPEKEVDEEEEEEKPVKDEAALKAIRGLLEEA